MTDIATEKTTATANGPATETVVFEGTIESAYGSKLADAKFKDGASKVSTLGYQASFEKLLRYEDIPAKEMPDRDDVLDTVNNARKANARQKAMQAALDGAGVVKPTLKDDVNLQVATIVKGMVAGGKFTEATATPIARKMLGLDTE